MQRLLAASLALLMAALPTVQAEWGAYGTDGWPVNVLGESTNPFPGLHASELDAALADPVNRPAGLVVYPYWPVLKAEVERLASEYPDRVRLHSAGVSTAGLDLFALEIADFANVEAGTGLPLEEREVVWVDGGTHSNEYSGVYFSLAWAQFLVESGNVTADWIVANRHTWVLPMVNPDGSHAFGRLNAHGVNINRNYPVIWDGDGHDAVLNNRGPSPASEVETQATIEWYNRTNPDYAATVHCCGNLWLYPYGQEGLDPLDKDMLARVCDEALAGVRDSCGPIWSTIYPASGSSTDTTYEYTGAAAFAYEMSGRGAVLLWGQPVVWAQVEEQERESWAALVHASLNVHLYGAHLVAESVAVAEDGAWVTLRNDGYGNFTGAVAQHASGEVELPPIAAGESRTIRVPAGGELVAEYAKRLEPDSNVAILVVPLGEAVESPPAQPASALPLALAVLGLAMVLARRRQRAA
jgi:MYXO-CTERM domain-containing protein